MPTVLLHDPARWPAQSAALRAALAPDAVADGEALCELLTRTSHGEAQGDDDFAGACELAEDMDEDAPGFWSRTLPHMVDLALRSAELFATPPAYLEPNVRARAELTREQVASVLALAFFDALPPAEVDPAWDMPDHLSVRHWLSGHASGTADGQKARCLLTYFQTHAEEASGVGPHADGEAGARAGEAAAHGEACGVTITRLVLPHDDGVVAVIASAWTESTIPLSSLRVVGSGGIEEASGTLQADFACASNCMRP